MKKTIGILYGMENTFPGALVDRINGFDLPEVSAELVQVGGVRITDPSRYDVIIDRISHDVPFYRAWLKHCVLEGAYVINNPFWTSADDKFFNYTLATKLGVAVPPTVILPHKEHPPGTTERSLRNLQHPLDWDGIFDYVGLPAFLKPFDGSGWRDVFRVSTREEFFRAYDQSRTSCMLLQSAVQYTEYFRCYVVGQELVHIMAYDPAAPFHERYVANPPAFEPELLARVERDAVSLCRALGYEFNNVEFAVEDGIPYAIDFLNPAPEAELHTVGPDNFEWVVEHVAELAVRKAFEPRPPATYRWDRLLAEGWPAADA